MTIAVHISTGKHEHLSDNFNFVCFSMLAASLPDHHFIFIFNSAPNPETYLEPNCTPFILPPVLKNSLLRNYWYNYKLPGVIDKYNADACITDGPTCSFKLTIPQCMVVRGKQMKVAKKNVYLKRFLPALVKKAAHIFCVDEYAAESIRVKFAAATKLSLLYPGLRNEGILLSYDEREAIKEEFTSGNEYFLYLSSDAHLEKVKIVLKAFSILKKWQKSSMQMVLVTSPPFEEVLLKELALYKYRKDILLTANNASFSKLIGGAHALLSENNNPFFDILPAMKSGVPVIVIQDEKIKNTLSAAIETIWSEISISEKMMKLYKDESWRSEIINQGFENAAKYSWEETTKTVWEVLSNLMHPETA